MGIYEFITVINALALFFYSVLWTLGTMDRKKVLKILDGIQTALQNAKGNNGEKTEKRG